MAQELSTTGVERFFEADEIIVSKTDLKGRITYANQVFLRLADYTEQEVLGAPLKSRAPSEYATHLPSFRRMLSCPPKR